MSNKKLKNFTTSPPFMILLALLLVTASSQLLKKVSMCMDSCTFCPLYEPTRCIRSSSIESCQNGYTYDTNARKCVLYSGLQSNFVTYEYPEERKTSIEQPQASSWKQGKVTECSYVDNTGAQKFLSVIGMFKEIHSISKEFNISEHHDFYIYSFNIIRTSWMPRNDFLIIDMEAGGELLGSYEITYDNKNGFQDYSFINCGGQQVVTQKFSIKINLNRFRVGAKVKITMTGFLFTSYWGITNIKFFPGCERLTGYNRVTQECELCDEGFYRIDLPIQPPATKALIQRCSRCSPECKTCTNASACTSCIKGYKLLNNGTCQSNDDYVVVPLKDYIRSTEKVCEVWNESFYPCNSKLILSTKNYTNAVNRPFGIIFFNFDLFYNSKLVPSTGVLEVLVNNKRIQRIDPKFNLTNNGFEACSKNEIERWSVKKFSFVLSNIPAFFNLTLRFVGKNCDGCKFGIDNLNLFHVRLTALEPEQLKKMRVFSSQTDAIQSIDISNDEMQTIGSLTASAMASMNQDESDIIPFSEEEEAEFWGIFEAEDAMGQNSKLIPLSAVNIADDSLPDAPFVGNEPVTPSTNPATPGTTPSTSNPSSPTAPGTTPSNNPSTPGATPSTNPTTPGTTPTTTNPQSPGSARSIPTAPGSSPTSSPSAPGSTPTAPGTTPSTNPTAPASTPQSTNPSAPGTTPSSTNPAAPGTSPTTNPANPSSTPTNPSGSNTAPTDSKTPGTSPTIPGSSGTTPTNPQSPGTQPNQPVSPSSNPTNSPTANSTQPKSTTPTLPVAPTTPTRNATRPKTVNQTRPAERSDIKSQKALNDGAHDHMAFSVNGQNGIVVRVDAKMYPNVTLNGSIIFMELQNLNNATLNSSETSGNLILRSIPVSPALPLILADSKSTDNKVYAFHTDKSYLDHKATVYSFKNSVKTKLTEFNLERTDFLQADSQNVASGFDSFFSAFAWITLILAFLSILSGKAYLVEESIQSLQIIFLVIYSYTSYLPSSIVNTISGLRRLENFDFFVPSHIQSFENMLLGDLIQVGPLKFSLFHRDINFIRGVIPLIVLTAIIGLWFLIVNVISSKLRKTTSKSGEVLISNNNVNDEVTEANAPLHEKVVKNILYGISLNKLDYWVQVFRLMFLPVVFLCFKQFNNFSYPDQIGGSIFNMIFCLVAFVGAIIGCIILTVYIAKVYFKLQYETFIKSYPSLYYKKIPTSYLPTENHRIIFPLMRYFKVFIFSLFIALLGDHTVALFVAMAAIFAGELFYAWFTEIYQDSLHLKFLLIDSLLTSILLFVHMIISLISSSVQTTGYLAFGYFHMTICIVVMLNGMGRSGYLIANYLKSQKKVSQKQDQAAATPVGSQRIV